VWEASELVMTQHCNHTLSILWQHGEANHQDKIAKWDPLWDCLMVKVTSVTLWIDLWTTVMTLVRQCLQHCVWVRWVFTELIKPKHIDITIKISQAWHNDQYAKDDNWSSKQKGARHVEETHGMTFSVYKHACCWKQNDMMMINSTSSYTIVSEGSAG